MSKDTHTFENRNHNLDLLRILAMIGVVVIHAAAPVVLNSANHDSRYATALVYDAFSRFCVPIFIMISGALMFSFDKDIDSDPWQYYIKKIKRFLPAILFWWVFYLFFDGKVAHFLESKNISEALKSFGGVPYYHMWYVYMLPGLFFLAPLLMFLKRKVTPKQWFILAVVFMIFGIIHNAIRQSEGWPLLSMVEFFDFIGYLLLGDILFNTKRKLPKLLLAIGFIGGSLVLATCLFYLNRSYIASFLDPLIIIPTVSLYLLINQGVSFAKSKFLYDVALSSFGIYLVHAAIIDTIMKYTKFSLTSFVAVDIFLYTVIALILSYLVIKVARSVKWFKWIT